MIARYARPAMARIWSDESRLARWLDVELAALEAWSEVGAIPADEVASIRERAVAPSPERVAEIERVTDHDVAAFVDAVAEYGRTARERGLRVLIAGAGLAAALPGVLAAHTDLPVIGVPLRSSKSVLDGLDALLSIVQMPPGVPVACVGVDNAKNAAVLAARILGPTS